MYPMMYYSHNLDFGAASYAMIGQFKEAKEYADEMSSKAAKMAKEMPPVEPFTSDSLKVLLRFGKWADILRAPDQSGGPISSAFRHFARAIAFARLDDVAGAKSEQKMFEADVAKMSDDTGFLQNTGKALAAVMAPLIEGRIAAAAGDQKLAIAAYRRAVDAEDALNYDEPSDWFYPTRETLGAALLRARDLAAAEKVFRDDLARNPNNPRSLYGLAAALKAQGKSAAKTAAEFTAAWKGGTGDPLR